MEKPSFMSNDDFQQAVSFAKAIRQQEDAINKLLADPSCKFTLDVVFDSDTGKWGVYNQMCSLGGCYIGGSEFDTKEEAYRDAALRTLLGDKITWNTPCWSCYTEYIKQCE